MCVIASYTTTTIDDAGIHSFNPIQASKQLSHKCVAHSLVKHFIHPKSNKNQGLCFRLSKSKPENYGCGGKSIQSCETSLPKSMQETSLSQIRPVCPTRKHRYEARRRLRHRYLLQSKRIVCKITQLWSVEDYLGRHSADFLNLSVIDASVLRSLSGSAWYQTNVGNMGTTAWS